MPEIDSNLLAVMVSLILLGHGVFGLVKPDKLAGFLRNYSRNIIAGYITMVIGTVWFIVILENENLADFGVYKTKMQIFFGVLGIGALFYLKDYLAVRGTAILLMLMAKLVIETIRLEDTDWRILFIAFAYIWIITGILFTVSPWRFRDLANWKYANTGRTKNVCAASTVVGVIMLVVGLSAF